jgi:NodT family efflux transporter outer membrane factor (OMF) lipoprotein
LFAAVEISACSTIGAAFQRPEVAVPSAWRGPSPAQVSTSLSPDWWRGFGSQQLADLVAQAETGNLDLAAAIARVNQADAQARIAGAALLPAVGFGGGVSRVRQPASGSSALGSSASRTNTFYDAQLSASYEIDFWGKNHAALDAAKTTAEARRYDRDTVALTTAASVATVYFQILALRDQLAVTTANVAAAQEILDAIRAQEAAGIASELDVAQQETVVASLRAQIPPLEQGLRQFTDALAVLIGKPPEALDITSGSLDAVSDPVVAPGLPSDLLQRRPDIAMAEAQLKAANANITVARAAFYPSIQLTAQGGFESTALSSLFGPAGLLYTLAAGVTQPIFEGGRLQGQLQFSQAVYDELVQNYRKAVLSGFQDVEDALIAAQKTAEQQAQQQAAVDTAQRAYDIAMAQLRSGTINVLTALNTETALFSARNTLVQVKLARLNASVSLFKALGGGWSKSGDTNA